MAPAASPGARPGEVGWAGWGPDGSSEGTGSLQWGQTGTHPTTPSLEDDRISISEH